MRASVRASTFSNSNISKTTRPIVIKFYLKHRGGGKVALGFGPGRIGTLVSMATDSPHRLTMGKCPVVLYINPVNRAPGVHTGPAPWPSWGKYNKNLLLRNHKSQTFHILCVAMYSGPLYKSCQPCPWGPYRPRPGGVMGQNIKKILFSETTRPKAFIF